MDIFLLYRFHPVSAHQQTMGVDAIRRARHECTVLFPFFDLKLVRLRRKNNCNFIYLIRQDTVKNRNGKCILRLQLVQIRKEFGTWQTSVRRQHRMGRGSSHRKAAAFQMTACNLQNTIPCSMVNRKLYLYFGNRNVSHNPRSGNIQRLLITGQFRRFIEQLRMRCELLIIFFRLLKIRIRILLRHFCCRFLVICYCAGLVFLVDIIADRRV